ncbi:MAG: tetratricopeptide repeat protein [Chloroflexota bacterium]|nr:tetratricopeptide repeat protein [Chloroflexota bacterium]
MTGDLSFGCWLKQQRQPRDLTREEVAHQVHCSVVTIRKIEAGERRPSKEIAARLAECLGVIPEDRLAFVRFARSGSAPGPGSVPDPPHVEHQPVLKPQSHANNLPSAVTKLIGREQEVAAACNSLRHADVRLLTLVGSPGIGKTRLSIEIATRLQDAFADGLYFVALTPIADPCLVPAAIAQTLGVKETVGQTLEERLAAYLRDKQLLLVLDNCEHLLRGMLSIAGLLAACSGLKVLVTSRAPLQLRGERQFPVPPLLLPELGHLPPLDELANYAAVAVFVERSQAVAPTWVLTDDNRSYVATICARLGGVPLALELAAARSKLLSPRDLLARLDQQLVLLTDAPRDMPPRHRTLRAALDWSYNLLPPPEQALLAQVAVFGGGFTLEAAEAVCQEWYAPPTASSRVWTPAQHTSVLDSLTALVNNSLLVEHVHAEQQTRFTLLEMIREYALERLDERHLGNVMRERHATYFLALAEQADAALQGPNQPVWLAVLETEHDNLRLALQWALGHRRGEIALRVCAALWRFWWLHGHLDEGRRWLEQALAGDDLPGLAWAKALHGLGVLLQEQGKYEQARARYEESLVLRRDQGDTRGVAAALNSLGVAALDQGDYAAAQRLYEESLALKRELGDKHGIANSLNNLGMVASAQGDHERAAALYEASLAFKRELGDKHGMAVPLGNLGALALDRNDPRARTFFVESLLLFEELGEKDGVAECLEGLAGVAMAQGRPDRAARLCAAATVLREAIGAPLIPAERTRYNRILAGAHAQLDEASFAAVWNEGTAMTPEQRLAYALTD